MNAEPITERLSEKPKRGRPRSERRLVGEKLAAMGLVPGGSSARTRVDWAFHILATHAVKDAGEAAQRALWGACLQDITAGRAKLPRGWQMAAVEVGRWIDAGGDAPAAVRVVAEARARGVPFVDVAAHFRCLRLGDKRGNAAALLNVLARALDDYRRRFPATTPDEARAAAAGLLAAIEAEGDAA